MSKNVVIQEGGLGKQMTVNKLRTNLVGGGSCNWIPEDEVQLTTKTITADGTYNASDDGCYGYRQVTVSGIGQATGTGPDGEDHAYTEDGEGGVTDTILPHSIQVVTPPTVTTYADGETIDFSGMVVKAYLKSGAVWSDTNHPSGVIPISELILPVTKAHKDESYSDKWSDGNGLNVLLISYTPHWGYNARGQEEQFFVSQVLGTYNGDEAMLGGGGPTQFFATFYDDAIYVFGSTANRNMNGYHGWINDKDHKRYGVFKSTGFTTGTGNVKHTTVDYSWATAIPTSTKAPTGTEELHPIAVPQTIPVQWARRGDNEVLETSFDISVAQGSEAE